MPRYFSTLGAPGCIQSVSLYERRAVTELWSRMTAVAKQQWIWMNVPDKEDLRWLESQRRLLQVYGPPGSGKSSAAFRWVYLVSRTCRTRALWISCGKDLCWSIDGRAGNGRVEIRTCAIPQNASDASGTPIVVFDGIRNKNLDTWDTLMMDMAGLGIAVFVISSEGVRFHDGDSQHVMKLMHFVPSWTKEEYIAACSDNGFWELKYTKFLGGAAGDQLPRRQQLIDSKFPIAGHSARFMFQFFERNVTRTIAADAQAMGGIDSLEEAVRNTRSAGAVNGVIARLQDNKNGITPQGEASIPRAEDLQRAAANRDDLVVLLTELDTIDVKPRLVSAYASDEVARHIPSSIQRLRSVARALNNRVIEGYAFEQQLKQSLREARHPGRSLSIATQSGQTEQLQVERFVECAKADLAATLVREMRTLQPNTWVFVAGQQGAFDAVHVVSNSHLRFVQSTVGLKHTFYLDIVHDLLVSLAQSNVTWTHIEFMVLRPWQPTNERQDQFRLEPARGRIDREYFRFDNERWEQRDCRTNVIYKFLAWTEDIY